MKLFLNNTLRLRASLQLSLVEYEIVRNCIKAIARNVENESEVFELREEIENYSTDSKSLNLDNIYECNI